MGFLRVAFKVDGAPVPLAVPALSPEPIYVRPGASDRSVLFVTLWSGFDNAPEFIPRDRSVRVWDLGANIGLTAALYATELPRARISGVELDETHAALARRNVAAFSDRCDILTGAVWIEDGTVAYVMKRGGEQRARVTSDGTGRVATAYSLNTLFRDDPWIDLVKMDIEGSEIRVLRESVEWAAKVGCIKVECHRPYDISTAIADVEKLGFAATRSTAHRYSVLGVRPH